MEFYNNLLFIIKDFFKNLNVSITFDMINILLFLAFNITVFIHTNFTTKFSTINFMKDIMDA